MYPPRVANVRKAASLAVRWWLGACGSVALFGIAACSTTAPEAKNDAHANVPAPREMVAEVRQAGIATSTELTVTPLRDPQVEDLRDRAKVLEARSDIAGAAQAIAQAMTLVPGDPELLQQAAEYALYRKDWQHAAFFAQESFDRGPKLGGLCRRNWTTLRFVRLVHGDAIGVQDAAQRIATCTVAPPARM
jgi:hypothetical protein